MPVQPATPINQGGSLNSGRLAFFYPDAGSGNFLEAIGALAVLLPQSAAPIATITISATDYVVGQSLAAGDGWEAATPASLKLTGASGLTMAWCGVVRGVGSTTSCWVAGTTYSASSGTAPYAGYSIFNNSAGPWTAITNNGTYGLITDSGTATVDILTVFVLTVNTTSGVWILYRNGVDVASGSGMNGDIVYSDTQFVIGHGQSTGRTANVETAGVSVWNRVLTGAAGTGNSATGEIATISTDFWTDMRGTPDSDPPTDPTSATCTLSTSGRKVTLSWGASTDAILMHPTAPYEVSRKLGSGSYSVIGSTTSTSYEDFPPDFATYTYRVRARDAASNYSGYAVASAVTTIETRDAEGFHIFEQPTGAIRIYVSTSGNNANDGLTTEAPKQTVAGALSAITAGRGDRISLKCGDTFTAKITFTSSHAGFSKLAPLLVDSYGSGARPIINPAGGETCQVQGNDAANYIALVGLKITCSDHNGTALLTPVGIGVAPGATGTDGWLIEDCELTNLWRGITFGSSGYCRDFEVFRCIIWNCYTGPNTGNYAVGIYTATCRILKIRENVFYRCGYVPDVVLQTGTAQAGGASTITLAAGASATDNFYTYARVTITAGTGSGQTRYISGYVGATKVATVSAAWSVQPDNTSVYTVKDAITSTFMRNIYLDNDDSSDVICNDNITAESGSSGMQFRTGGYCYRNLCLYNKNYGIVASTGDDTDPADCYVKWNVVLDSQDGDIASPFGGGIGCDYNGITGHGVGKVTEVSENICAYRTASATYNVGGIGCDNGAANVTVQNNIVYDWWISGATQASAFSISGATSTGIVVTANDFQMPNGAYVLINYPNTGATYTSNRYVSDSNANFASISGGVGLKSFAQWVTLTSDTSTYGAVTYSDPARAISNYMTSISGTATLAGFMAGALAQRKGTWDQNYRALTVINYVRTGFDKSTLSDPYPETGTSSGSSNTPRGGRGRYRLRRRW